MHPRSRVPKSRALALRCLCVCVVALALVAVGPTLRAARSLVLLSDLTQGPKLGPLTPALLYEVSELQLSGKINGGVVRMRRYVPIGVTEPPGIVLLHGVHPRGIDESRLRGFAHTLAAGGMDVLTPEISELLSYRIEAATVAKIRELAAFHARSTARKEAGVFGISFAGGLALMAAAQQPDHGPIGFVVSVGAHHDLMRLCRYYAGEKVLGPNGEPADVAPHPYGARVMMREHLERFFKPADVPIARRSLDLYLRDRGDLARRVAATLSPEGQPMMTTLLEPGNGGTLAQLLMLAAAAVSDKLAQASPKGQLAGLRVPAFLVHGAADPIIPSIETRWLAREVPPETLRALVITELLRHAEFPRPPSASETWELVRLMRDILQRAGSAQRLPSAGEIRPRMPNSKSASASSERLRDVGVLSRLRKNVSLNAPINAVAITSTRTLRVSPVRAPLTSAPSTISARKP
jgi:pimeloyl-ACP methyl ester carboxylesterase